MESPEARLKCFLHYGNEERVYIPNRNTKHSFEPEKVSSIHELLCNEETAKTIIPTIVKVLRGQYSVEPFACIYALALVVRKAGELLPKENTSVGKQRGTQGETPHSGAQAEVPQKGVAPQAVSSEDGAPQASEPQVVEPKKKGTKSDHLICDVYKAARKLSEDNAEYFLTFTHYLREIAKTQGKKGFGKGWRNTVRKWYSAKDPLTLTKEVTKLHPTAPWSHKDVLKLCRHKTSDNAPIAAMLTFVQHGYQAAQEKYGADPVTTDVLKLLKVVDQLRRADSDAVLLDLITSDEYALSIEFCPDKFLSNHEVWLALIPRMSFECLLSKINRMSKLKLFKHHEVVAAVVRRFEEYYDDRIHPIHVYVTRKQYEEGPNLAIEFQYLQRRRDVENSGENAGNDNSVAVAAEVEQIQRQPPPRRSQEIINSLNLLWNKTFQFLSPTGMRYLIALDSQAAVQNKRCSFERFVSIEESALLVSLCIIKTERESNVKLVTFTKDPTNLIKEIPVSKADDTMETLKNKINRDDSTPANIQQLIQWATTTKEFVDVFIVLGDNTLNPNGAHEALKVYQETVNGKAKVITCCFIGPHKKIKELTKPGMFLICGFDRKVGRLIDVCSRGAF